MDAIKSDKRIQPDRVIIDHVEEHTVKLVLDAGMWAGMTLYPESKCSPARAIDMVEMYGNERIWMNCACDWGVSDPLAVPKTAWKCANAAIKPKPLINWFIKIRSSFSASARSLSCDKCLSQKYKVLNGIKVGAVGSRRDWGRS